jgi:hypothetical protein
MVTSWPPAFTGFGVAEGAVSVQSTATKIRKFFMPADIIQRTHAGGYSKLGLPATRQNSMRRATVSTRAAPALVMRPTLAGALMLAAGRL